MFSPARAYGYHGLQQWRGATDVTLENVSLRLPATGAKRKQIIPRRTTATGSASRVPARDFRRRLARTAPFFAKMDEHS